MMMMTLQMFFPVPVNSIRSCQQPLNDQSQNFVRESRLCKNIEGSVFRKLLWKVDPSYRKVSFTFSAYIHRAPLVQ